MAIPQPSSLAARREVRPLPFLQTSLDDSLLHATDGRSPSASKSTTDLVDLPRRSFHRRRGTGASSIKSVAPSVKSTKTKVPLAGLFSRGKKFQQNEDTEITQKPPNFSRPDVSSRKSLAISRPSFSRQRTTQLSKTQTQDSQETLPPLPRSRGRGVGVSDTLRDTEPISKRDKPPLSPLSNGWSPPPLFQAFPQAIVHSSLEDPDYHTLILNRGKRRIKNLSKSDDPSDFDTRRSSLSRPSTGRKVSCAGTDQVDGQNAKASSKTYVLATTGYLLQYSGEGASDRKPEKILKLGPKSAAFASDAIPGKHWVIQVLQAASDDETNPFGNQKSFFGRFLPSSITKRRATRSMLLVLSSPSEMNKWLGYLRREILKHGQSRPRSPSKRSPSVDSRKTIAVPQRVMKISRPSSPSNLSKPPSPTKSQPSAPSMPNSPLAPDSSFTSSGTTLVCAVSACSSDCSEKPPIGVARTAPGSLRQPSVSVEDSRQAMRSQLIEQWSQRRHNAVPPQPPNTAVPPLTPTLDLNVELASSPDQTNPSPRRKANLQSSEAPSQMESPEQDYFTPMTTPMQSSFTRLGPSKEDMANLPTHSSTLPPTPGSIHRPSKKSPSGSPTSRLQSGDIPRLKQSKSTPSLYTLNPRDDSEPQRSTYLAHSTSEGLAAEATKSMERVPGANAFAQAKSAPSSRRSSIQPPQKEPPKGKPLPPAPLCTVKEYPALQKEPRRTSIRSTKPLPLHTANQSNQRQSSKLFRNSFAVNFGDGLQHVSQGAPSDRTSALLQLSGEQPRIQPDAYPSIYSQPSPHLDAFPTPSPATTADRPLRRPPTITVRTDVTPLSNKSRHLSGQVASASTGGSTPLSSSRSSVSAPNSRLPTPASAISRSPASATASPANSNRGSILVPVVRPATVKHSSKSSRQVVRLSALPTSKPPEIPLPPPPPGAVQPHGLAV